MSEQFIQIHQLNAISDGKYVSNSSFSCQEDVNVVVQGSTDSVINSVNKIATALHLITMNI